MTTSKAVDQANREAVDLASLPRVTIELKPDGKQPESLDMPIQGTMYVQDAVEHCRAAKRFRRMKIEVMRSGPEGKQKMASKYLANKGMVDPAYDYALYPGDHVVITEEKDTLLDEMLGPLAGPLRQMNGL